MEVVEKGTVGDTCWCAICHEISGPFLDTGRWIGRGTTADEYGYVCFPCAREFGRGIGMVEGEEVAKLQESLSEALTELQSLKETVAKVQTAQELEKELSAA